jgi:hypothetical protein
MEKSILDPIADGCTESIFCSWGMRPLPVPEDPGKRTGPEEPGPVRSANDPREKGKAWKEPDKKT